MTRFLGVCLLGLVGFAIIFASPSETSPVGRVVEAQVRDEQTIRDLRRLVRKVSVQRNRAQRRVRRQYLLIDRQRRQLAIAAARYGSIPQLIEVAATAYGQSAAMLLRKAECESGLWPFARNRSSNASGLFQFLPSTWDSTPFRRHSIWDPWAQALAASWMHSHLRGGEWVCR